MTFLPTVVLCNGLMTGEFDPNVYVDCMDKPKHMSAELVLSIYTQAKYNAQMFSRTCLQCTKKQDSVKTGLIYTGMHTQFLRNYLFSLAAFCRYFGVVIIQMS